MKKILLLIPLLLTNALALPDLSDAGASWQTLPENYAERGTNFSFTTAIDNKGDQDATDVKVRFFLSEDQIAGDPGDQLVGTVSVPWIKSEDRAIVNANLSMPRLSQQEGPYWLVWTFAIEKDENDSDNNGIHLASQMNTNSLISEFDLHGGNVTFNSVSTSTPRAGTTFTVSHNVCNDGPGASTGYAVRYFLSENDTLGDNDNILLGEFAHPSIAAPVRGGACVNISHQLFIPEDVVMQRYYLAYRIVATHDQDQLNNRVVFADQLSVRVANGPDLTDAGSSYWALPPGLPGSGISSVLGGESFEIEARVRNTGNQDSGDFTISFYASKDNVLGDSDDISLGSRSYGNVGRLAGTLDINPTLPSKNLVPDELYFIGWTINSASDVDTSNNSALMNSPIFIREFSRLEFVDDWTAGGNPTTHNDSCVIFRGSMRNTGNVPVEAGRLEVTLKSEGFFGAELVGSCSRDVEIPPDGQAHPVAFVIERRYIGDLISGSYTGTIRALGEEREIDTTEITNLLEVIRKGHPDLQIELSRNGNEVLNPNGVLSLDLTARNIGSENSPATTVQIFLNEAPVGAPFSVPALEKRDRDGSYTVTVSLPLQNAVPVGRYEIMAVIDPENSIQENSECNNTNRNVYNDPDVGFGRDPDFFREEVTIALLPDLRESIPAQEIPNAVFPGEAFPLNMRVINFGFGNASSFKVRFLLSDDDEIVPGEDSWLRDITVNRLDQLSNIDLGGEFRWFFDTIPEGDYYIGWIIDVDDDIHEEDETNNIGHTEYPIRVGSGINLEPGNIPFALSSEVVEVGDPVSLTGSWVNSGNIASSGFRYKVNLRRTQGPAFRRTLRESLIGTRVELAQVSHPVDLALTIPEDIQPGEYEIVYILDSGSAINETREDDNRARVPLTIVPKDVKPVIVDFKIDDTDTVITWTSRPDREYKLQTTGSLNSWLSGLEKIQGQVGTTEHAFPEPRRSEKNFYRIIEVPVP